MSAEELVAKVQRSKKPITGERMQQVKDALRKHHVVLDVNDSDVRVKRLLEQGYRTGDVEDVHLRPRGSKGVEVCLDVVLHELPRKFYTGRTRASVPFNGVQLTDRCPSPLVT